MKKKGVLIWMLICVFLVSACGKSTESISKDVEKGYDLPIEDKEREAAKQDCRNMMEQYSKIYECADKGDASNVILSDETVLEIQEQLRTSEVPVGTAVIYSDMKNYEEMDKFLRKCINGESGSITAYEVRMDGGIERRKYCFNGKEMYLLCTSASWNDQNCPVISQISYTRIEEWKYTEKGWFGYKLCVPEYPEVTEAVDGSYLIRVKPMDEECKEMAEKCVLHIRYQGNNLLCSDWDTAHMEELDYNGVYEYLYEMKFQKALDYERYLNGIPKDEFESLIMEYLPVTADQIHEYAVFDEENHSYAWTRLGCLNYSPTIFATSLPEVTAVNENADGTLTFTVNAVCDMVICDDALITHELTVKFSEDGSFQYLGNKILNNGTENIPEYQYRFKRK